MEAQTHGVVVWLSTYMAQSEAGPAAEPRHFEASMSIPHCRDLVDQDVHALRKVNTWRLVPPKTRVSIQMTTSWS
jgi:hypothetical protein